MKKQLKTQVTCFLNTFGEMEQRSMFGGTGFFHQDAMFALLTDKRFYLRGGGIVTDALVDKGCKKFVHVKKSSSAVVNYYDVTALFIEDDVELAVLVKASRDHALNDRAYKARGHHRRLRDLPNLRLTIERMLKKSGVEDISTFYSMAPEEIFRRLQVTHGNDLDLCLLWKLAGAQQGRHWKLIEEDERERLLSAV